MATDLATRAERDLTYIRETLERAGTFRALPGWGSITLGGLGFLAAAISRGASSPALFSKAWVTVSLFGLAVGLVSLHVRARATRTPLVMGAGRAFLLGLLTPLGAGALLTIYAMEHGHFQLLPGLWLLLYGVSVLSASRASDRFLIWMGSGFVALSIPALFGPASWADELLAAGFGGLHTVFGIWIVRRYGG